MQSPLKNVLLETLMEALELSFLERGAGGGGWGTKDNKHGFGNLSCFD